MTTVPMMPSAANASAVHAGDFAFPHNYQAAPGAIVNVPTYDVGKLLSSGWIRLPASGGTAVRPVRGAFDFVAGAAFYDTDIAKLIVFDGVTWRDPLLHA